MSIRPFGSVDCIIYLGAVRSSPAERRADDSSDIARPADVAGDFGRRASANLAKDPVGSSSPLMRRLC